MNFSGWGGVEDGYWDANPYKGKETIFKRMLCFILVVFLRERGK